MTGDPGIESFFEQAQDRLVTQSSDFSLRTIETMVSGRVIDVAPAYQRRERWSAKKQSALIESFVLNVPVPPVYLSEDEFGTYSIIDGKQRLTAVARFLTDDLALTGLEEFPQMNGLVFSELPVPIRNALEVRPYIRVITLLKQSDPELKYEVFTRLNTGGEPLNAQEIRNVAFRGPLNDLVYELADHPFLKQQLKIKNLKSAAARTMLDAELVVRFFTLGEHWTQFSGELRRSMDSFMKTHQFAEPASISSLRAQFLRSLGACEALWGERAFKRPDGDGWRDQALAGMFDAQMVSVAQLSNDELADLAAHPRSELTGAVISLFRDADFEEAVRVATNTPSRVRLRISKLVEELQQLAGA